MTIMQQMNLFNTSSEVAGFKLDYLEVWNWGTFDKKVYHMNLHGNNSLLTGANASGKSTLIDALLTLMVPLKRQRFYNQSSGVEKKGNRTEESYFFGNYGNQQQEGAASTTTLRLRDKGARSVLLASFCNVDKRVGDAVSGALLHWRGTKGTVWCSPRVVDYRACLFRV